MYINHTHLPVVRITISNQKTHQVDGEYSQSATGVLRYHSSTFPGNVLHSILAGHTGPPRNYPESKLRGKPGFEAGPGPCNTSMHRQLSVVFFMFFFLFSQRGRPGIENTPYS